MPETTEIDFTDFHTDELPRRLAEGNGALAIADVADAGPIAFRVPEGAAFTYIPAADGIDVVAGTDGARTIVDLGADDWAGIVADLETAPSLLYSGRASCQGNPLRFVRWESALRSMYCGVPIFDPAAADLSDRSGEPLDPARSFGLDGNHADMAHFLDETGYLVVRDVFSEAEVAELVIAADDMRARAREGDKRSWWGKSSGGETVLCRVTHAGRVPVFERLYEDGRVLELVDCSAHEMSAKAAGEEQGVTILWKNPDMVEGLSDIPWHRDCGMGGHATMCPLLIVTINLSDATAESGQLRMLPGSWKYAYNVVDANDPSAPSGVALDARAGDVSLHYGDVMHASPPPAGSGPYRTSALLAFVPPDAHHHRGEGQYNDVLLGREDGQVQHLRDHLGHS